MAGAALLLIGAGAPGSRPPADLTWLAPGADPVSALLSEPVEPLDLQGTDPETHFLIALGRIAFRAPDLLGGLAARQGMSCQSCHAGGGRNAQFFIEGLSNAPGTFDATNAVFSHRTEDGIDNPVAIPSLFGVAASAPYPGDGRFSALEDMVKHVIVDEFQGRNPPSLVMEGLLAYLSRLEGPPTMTDLRRAVTLDTELEEIRTMADPLDTAISLGDARLVSFIVQAARRALGRVAERFPDAPEARDTLAAWSLALRQVDRLVADGDRKAARRALKRWRDDLSADALAPFAATSLYSEPALKTWLTRSAAQ